MSRSSITRTNNPTATEMVRIRHTIDVLKRNEDRLLEKLTNIMDGSDSMLLSDLRQHASEISWGWQDLKRLVETLPDGFWDKHLWLLECANGLERGMSLCEGIERKFPVICIPS